MPDHQPTLDRAMKFEGKHVVKIVLNPKQVEIVNRLLAEGLHGNTAGQVVKRLFCEGCIPHAPRTQPK